MQGQPLTEGGALPGRRTHQVTDWSVTVVPASTIDSVPAALESGPALAAQVPGCVHTDLQRHGLIGDIAVDATEQDLAWVHEHGWRYTTRIDADLSRGRRATLEFGGLDTIATVTVNGVRRLSAVDMHRRFELDVTEDLRTGPAEVEVEFAPVTGRIADAERADPLPHPDMYPFAYNQIRKMACSFGWDWGPVTITAGIWRPVLLHSWTGGRLADVRVVASPADGDHDSLLTATVTVEEALAHAAAELVVRASGPDGPVGDSRTPITDGTATLDLPVPGARLWWPTGYGEQPLYDVVLELRDAEGALLDTTTRRVGFRTVEVRETPDEAGSGSGFTLTVNGLPVWVRGLNWIPDDPFPQRLSAERLRTRVQQAVDAGTNLLRVWGGGIFESEDFYDAADELGVLVWQDFLFACAAYPEDDATIEQVTAEIRDNVARLRHRASLVLWSGGNECLWGFEDWDWKRHLDGRPWGARYYYEIIPGLLEELDGTRPYIPGSPFSHGSAHPNSEDSGVSHIWDVWNEIDYVHYEDKRPRFVSEFGYQAPASWPTLLTAVGAEDLEAADPRLDENQKAESGHAKLNAGLLRHFSRLPSDGRTWYYATQLLQARAVSVGVGHLRSLHDRCSGAIWWQHNDCWPSISWALVDVCGRRKLGWYALRSVFVARFAVFGGGRDDARLTLVNDTAAPWRATVELRTAAADGSTRTGTTARVEVPAHAHVVMPVAGVLGRPGLDVDLLVADVDGVRSTRWLSGDLELKLPEGDPTVAVSPDGADAVLVTATAGTLLRDLCLLAEVVAPDAQVDRQLLTLLPGETATFRVTGPGVTGVTASAWANLLWHDARVRASVGA